MSEQFVASKLARVLVDQRLAACALIVSEVQSVYRSQGVVCESTEVQVWFKTTAEHAGQLRERLEELHPHELPQIVQLTAESSAAYLEWVNRQLA